MPSSPSRNLEGWNRKLHFYLGLYFLFFLWLFSFTGLLLNHPQWRFAQFWPERKETHYERPIQPPTSADDLDRAREIMRDLSLAGEIDWPTQKQASGRLDFTVNRPGNTNRVSADLIQNRAAVQQIQINSLGVMNVLHTFSGTRINNPVATRDWTLTTIWVIAMDALAAGLLVMVFSSYYMWYRLKQKRRFGLLWLAAGVLSCSFFLVGLTWLR
jgi:hypothetical protein